MTGASAKRFREEAEHLTHRVRVAFQNGHEVGPPQRERGCLGDGGHRCRPRRAVEEGEIPEDVTPALESDHDLVAGVVRHGYLHGPGGDEEDMPGLVVAVEDDLVAREMAGGPPFRRGPR